jgi:hypothetical protein
VSYDPSRAIQALEKAGLVEYLTPDEMINWNYRTTVTGKKIIVITEW